MKKILLLIASIMLLAGCAEKDLKPAQVIVVDPVRHYYPVLQGEMMHVSFEMENISENPLFIQEVQTSCGCLTQRDALPIVILPHKRGYVSVDFNTIKNNGYVEHFIYCYGNFKDSSEVVLSFDTNVVPKGDFSRDYEELWQEQTGTSIKEAVDGKSGEKGYYTD